MSAKRFLFVIVEGGGNIPPQLGMARRLVARGHVVRVLGDPAIEAEVRAAGCEFAPFRLAPHHNMRSRTADQVRDWEPKSPLAQLEKVTSTLMFGPAAKYARDVLDELERFAAHAVVVDFMLFGALIGAEKSGLPTAMIIHCPYNVPTPGIPPFGMGFHPARGPFGRLRDRLLSGLMVRTFNKKGKVTVNAAREGLGLAPLTNVFDQWLRADRLLVLTTREYDFTSPAMPAHVRYVGPQLDDPEWAQPWRSPWPDDHADPLVVVGLGSTFQNQAAITGRVIEALGGMKVRGLVTLGGVFSPDELPTRDNVVVVASAPHREVLPQARAVICHGGHGTVIKSLAHGVPVLCVPFGRDQKDNAARAEVAGAGLRLKPNAGVAAIRAAVQRLLDEPGFAEGARRLADAIARDVDSQAATHELEALAELRAVATRAVA